MTGWLKKFMEQGTQTRPAPQEDPAAAAKYRKTIEVIVPKGMTLEQADQVFGEDTVDAAETDEQYGYVRNLEADLDAAQEEAASRLPVFEAVAFAFLALVIGIKIGERNRFTD